MESPVIDVINALELLTRALHVDIVRTVASFLNLQPLAW